MSSEGLTTFRDPAGHLEFDSDVVRRHVGSAYAAEALAFLGTPVLARWVQQGQVVPSTVLPSEDGLVLEHPRLFFISYQWEWSPAQLRAAAELTLDLCSQAISAGYILKDATPSNVLFDGSRPVFVDVLSFEKRDPSNPLWLAHGQLIRSFLLPLLALRELGWPLAAVQIRRDGWEPAQLHAAMSRLQRLRPGVFGAVTLPAWFERSKGTAARPGPMRKSPEMATAILQSSLKSLRSQIRRAAPSLPASHWSRYTTTAAHYQPEDHARKQEFVTRVLSDTQPKTVLDIGANTGTYSALAARSGAQVVSLDIDPAAVEALWQMARREKLAILPLVADIARPTPALGWENSENFSLLDRLQGKFDLVLMLAVIHHLLLMDQVPLDRIAALVARITRRWAVVEWVPQSDPMFQFLLRGRDAIYTHLQLETMLAAFAPLFSVSARTDLANGRTLFLLEKR
jgi:hypothetical protein